MDEAESSFRAALGVQPGFPIGYARLATLLRGGLPGDDLAALEEKLASPGLEPLIRARLLFSLAHVLDARREFARAAGCLREADALTLAASGTDRPYKADDNSRFVDGLIREIGPDFFRRTIRDTPHSRRLVFVFGLPRTGTTLTEQILASHPLVYGAGETTLARHAFNSIPSIVGGQGQPLRCLADLDGTLIDTLAGEYSAKLEARVEGCVERVVDKMPDNYMHLGLLAAMFPGAKFIHCRRDLRDVAVSCWMTDFRSIRWANDFDHIAGRIREYRRLMDHWRRVLPITVHDVNYADTVSDLEGTSRRLVEACGLGWDSRCLEFHRTQRAVRTASVTQVRKPIYTTSVDRWKNYEDHVPDLFESLRGPSES